MANIKKIKLVDNTEYDIVDASATHIQEITLAQWELLTPEQQASGDYVITDTSSALLDATLIPYDNTTSGLNADNVQEAIDEVTSHIEYISLGGNASASRECNVGTVIFIARQSIGRHCIYMIDGWGAIEPFIESHSEVILSYSDGVLTMVNTTSTGRSITLLKT